MKFLIAFVFTLVLYVVPLYVVYTVTGQHAVSHYVSTHTVMQWVKDPNTGTYYYGWYAADGTAFNSTETAPATRRFGDVQPSTLPVHFWERVR